MRPARGGDRRRSGRRGRPNVVSYGAAVSACARAGRNARLMSPAALSLHGTLWGLYDGAAADLVGADAYMIHSLAAACARVGDAEGAVRAVAAGGSALFLLLSAIVSPPLYAS
jgi:hypothetical protein